MIRFWFPTLNRKLILFVIILSGSSYQKEGPIGKLQKIRIVSSFYTETLAWTNCRVVFYIPKIRTTEPRECSRFDSLSLSSSRKMIIMSSCSWDERICKRKRIRICSKNILNIISHCLCDSVQKCPVEKIYYIVLKRKNHWHEKVYYILYF